jgi:hypothetical protein
MSTADIYRAEILRAVLGPRYSELKVDNPARLRQIAERLADSESVQEAIRALGYGCSGMSFTEMVATVPGNAYGRLRRLFSKPAPKPVPQMADSYPDLSEVHDVWSGR